jgi:hypothetical protein
VMLSGIGTFHEIARNTATTNDLRRLLNLLGVRNERGCPDRQFRNPTRFTAL